MDVICLCNGITDDEVRRALGCGAKRPKDVYAACACRAQCGKCTRDILALLRSTPPAPPELRA